jgi:predicted nucleic-acid-binding protein
MSAVDTNVLVRLIIADNPDQTALAKAKLAKGIFVSHGILMEAEWVLRSSYRLSRETIGAALSTLVSHDKVTVPQAEAAHWAIDRFQRGADFADMLHLVAAIGHPPFASFDQRIVSAAGPDTPISIELLQ